jgi:DNA polymerase-1
MREWIKTTIRTNAQANEMLRQLDELKPTIGAFDTETDGLHIIYSKPFLFQFGYLHPTEYKGYTYVVDIQRQPELSKAVINAWHQRVTGFKLYLAHNCKYDLHMLANIGLAYSEENVSDTMFYIRYAHDALTPKNGGPPMALKAYAARYICADARSHDKLIQAERTAIAKMLNAKLKERLKLCGTPPAKYNAKSYTLKVIDAIFSDPIADKDSFPDARSRQAYDDWLRLDVPLRIREQVTGLVETDMIPYDMCDRETVITYGHYDIIWVLETYESLVPVLQARDNEKGVEFEQSLVQPLFEMERVGFQADVPYLLQAQKNVKDYIIQQRQKLYTLMGEEFSIAQHAKVLTLLQQRGVPIESTRDDELAKVKSDMQHSDSNNPCIEIISLIQELRTLEKWYSVYIMRFVKDLKKGTRLYTTINQVGTVSGRVTSDFQQFPKQGITNADGEILFHPRHLICVDGDTHPATVYLDYSQIELRFQAFYTILVGHPDLNLCRAYMPYKCHRVDGTQFDYTNRAHITTAYDGSWLLDEDNTPWTPTDVHGATTKAAFGIDESDPRFHDLRYVGKRVNFAKNYGARFKKIWQMFPEYDEATAHRIDDAYYTAFPGVKKYHDYCYQRAEISSNTQNLFGIKYYGVSGHKLVNMLVQGSAAYYLKWKIRQLYDYSKKHNLKTKWQMQIHDELSWCFCLEDGVETLFEFKRIMEDWEDGQVPIVADMEISTATWADKKEVHTIDEARQLCSLCK